MNQIPEKVGVPTHNQQTTVPEKIKKSFEGKSRIEQEIYHVLEFVLERAIIDSDSLETFFNLTYQGTYHSLYQTLYQLYDSNRIQAQHLNLEEILREQLQEYETRTYRTFTNEERTIITIFFIDKLNTFIPELNWV